MNRIFAVRNFRPLPGTLVLAGSMMMASWLAVPAGAQEQSAPSADAPAVELASPDSVSLSESDPLFRAFDRIYTTGEWENIVALSPPDSMAAFVRVTADVNDLTEDVLANSIRDFAQTTAMANEAREKNIEIEEGLKQRLQAQTDILGIQVWLTEHNILDVDDVPAERIQAYYEENKDELFKREETLQLRHIFLSTYEPYTVVEGDTLEGIAEGIGGDKTLAEQILSEETKQPRVETTETQEGEAIGVRPLMAGERLMVPMGEAKANKVREKAQEIYQRLQGGEQFTELQAEMSEAATSVMNVRPKADQKPILPEIYNTFLELETGGFSEPIRTKHGYQIIYRQNYQPEEYVPLSEAEDQIRLRLENEIREERLAAKIAELWEKADLEVNEEALKNAFEEEAQEAVVVTLGDQELTVQQFGSQLRGKLTEETTLEERKELLKQTPAIQRYLIEQAVEQEKLEETEVYEARKNWVEDRLYAAVYGQKIIEERIDEPTEEEISAKYEEMKPQLMTRAEKGLWQISVEPTTDAQPGTPEYEAALAAEAQALGEKLKEVDTLDEFKEAARKYSTDEYQAAGGSRGPLLPNFMEGLGRELLNPQHASKVYGPIALENKVFAFWTEETTPSREQTLEEARERVVGALKNEQTVKLRDEIREEYIEKSGLEILFNL